MGNNDGNGESQSYFHVPAVFSDTLSHISPRMHATTLGDANAAYQTKC